MRPVINNNKSYDHKKENKYKSKPEIKKKGDKKIFPVKVFRHMLLNFLSTPIFPEVSLKKIKFKNSLNLFGRIRIIFKVIAAFESKH